MTACIVGWSHTKFGKLDDKTQEDLIVEVATQAIRDAGIEPKDVDAIYLGTFNGGLVDQDFPASLVLQADPGLRFKPATRLENACATGTAAVFQGLQAIAARKARFVLCVGVEKMTSAPNDVVGNILLKASYRKEESFGQGGFAAVFDSIQSKYFQKYGDQSDATAMIAAKNHKNGSVNPLAHMQRDFGYDFCRTVSDKNPYVVGGLKRTDCSMVSDGAAALVLTDVQTALGMQKAIAFRAAKHVQDFLPMSKRDVIAFEGPAKAWADALAEAGLNVWDLSFAESHDCFTIAELIEYEAMGLTAPGQGAKAILEGWTQKDGKLPINPSGGLKAKGHPIGATGVSMHVMAAMQLSGTAGALQVKDAKIGGVFNMGGVAVANYVSILEPIR
ncbi:acetyl-CoA acetyltransferase [Ferrovibrio sp.]|uniref:acetyl-CoA acetyltransferase n=1 Tax=Ferrovibrio sp. TaxID=1917215 RepID=UPI003D0FA69B